MRLRRDDGSAIAEFTMVAGLLCLVVLAVIQLALALHVRNTIQDAAAEGARFAGLANATLEDGVQRTEDLIATALGPGFAATVSAGTTEFAGHPAIEIQVTATLPLVGLLGPTTLEVSGHAATETLE